ncbi:2714_t:CDS:1, partial [Cetraspora pellucida]
AMNNQHCSSHKTTPYRMVFGQHPHSDMNTSDILLENYNDNDNGSCNSDITESEDSTINGTIVEDTEMESSELEGLRLEGPELGVSKLEGLELESMKSPELKGMQSPELESIEGSEFGNPELSSEFGWFENGSEMTIVSDYSSDDNANVQEIIEISDSELIESQPTTIQKEKWWATSIEPPKIRNIDIDFQEIGAANND